MNSKSKTAFALPLIVSLLALMLAVSGCARPGAGGSDGASAAERTAAESAPFPRTIQHAKGELVLDKQPTSIASLYFVYTDYLAVLDMTPISSQGMALFGSFPSLQKYVEGAGIIDLGVEPDLEKMLVSEPDLILAESSSMEAHYDSLKSIAPTVMIPHSEDWKAQLRVIAEAVGKEDKAEAVIADYTRKAAEYKQTLQARSGETVLVAMYNGKDFSTYDLSRTEVFYTDLGLTPTEQFVDGGAVSLESLAEANPDHLFVVNNYAKPIAGGVANALKDSTVWNNLKAVRSNQVYYLDDASIIGPMPLGKIIGIEEIMKALGHAQ